MASLAATAHPNGDKSTEQAGRFVEFSVKPKVLIAEPDPMLLEAMGYTLRQCALQVVMASHGADALALFKTEKPHLAVISANLTKVSGLRVCRALRRETASHLTLPIIVLGTGATTQARALALRAGADTYLTKPFKMGDFVTEVHALLCRAGVYPELPAVENLECGPVRIDGGRREVFWQTANGIHEINLTSMQFDLLYILVAARGRVVSRDRLLKRVWSIFEPENVYGEKAAIEQLILTLRGKIEADPSQPQHIVAVRGKGFKFRA